MKGKLDYAMHMTYIFELKTFLNCSRNTIIVNSKRQFRSDNIINLKYDLNYLYSRYPKLYLVMGPCNNRLSGSSQVTSKLVEEIPVIRTFLGDPPGFSPLVTNCLYDMIIVIFRFIYHKFSF